MFSCRHVFLINDELPKLDKQLAYHAQISRTLCYNKDMCDVTFERNLQIMRKHLTYNPKYGAQPQISHNSKIFGGRKQVVAKQMGKIRRNKCVLSSLPVDKCVVVNNS